MEVNKHEGISVQQEIAPAKDAVVAPLVRGRMFRQKNYWLLVVILGLVSYIGTYYVTIKASLTAIPIPKEYFAVALVLGLFLEGLLTAFSARMAKIEGRTWDKAFFAATGTNFINSVMSLIGLPLAKTNIGVAIIFSLLAGIISWYFLRRVYGITNKQVVRMSIWAVVVIGAIGIIAAVIGGFLFAAKLKEMGI